MTLAPEIILRHAAQRTPRYTSYPTAPHFHSGVDGQTYRKWLSNLPAEATLSLYLHVPFCDTLCWFCGCHTKITQRYAPVASYLEALIREIALVAEAAPRTARVTHIHWGGGSPTILQPPDVKRLADAVRGSFTLAKDAEFAVEVDPRGMTVESVAALTDSGLTRVSIGVQDFDPKVQAAINRDQSFEETQRVVDAFRAHGVKSLNIDAIYGLPHQQEAQLLATLEGVMRLAPDRVALFGYAHVPWMKKHQSQIFEHDLPDALERYRLAETAGDYLARAGFERVGVDHFARPSDALAIAAREQRVRRNFQGYTVDSADALIGLGASAISRLPQGFAQNETAILRYQSGVEAGGLPVARGIALSEDDRLRSRIIERLMCNLSYSSAAVAGAEEELAKEITACAARAMAGKNEGFIRETSEGFEVTETGRPFVRTIAAYFDNYLERQAAKHSLAV